MTRNTFQSTLKSYKDTLRICICVRLQSKMHLTWTNWFQFCLNSVFKSNSLVYYINFLNQCIVNLILPIYSGEIGHLWKYIWNIFVKARLWKECLHVYLWQGHLIPFGDETFQQDISKTMNWATLSCLNKERQKFNPRIGQKVI